MPAGIPTEEETVAEFRARYLYSGNASAVGRDMEIPERTARKLAERLEDDPSFAEDGRKLRERALARHVAMRLAVCEKASERFHDKDGGIDVKKFGEYDQVVITDKRADYGKLVLEAEKNAHNLARFEAEKGGQIAPEREVIVRFEPIAKKPDDGET